MITYDTTTQSDKIKAAIELVAEIRRYLNMAKEHDEDVWVVVGACDAASLDAMRILERLQEEVR